MTPIDHIFDLAYYQEQGGQGQTKAEAIEHYRTYGASGNLNPNRRFHSQWYGWQHPETRESPSPLDHFVKIGCDRLFDPTPMVDFRKYHQLEGKQLSPEESFQRLLTKGGSTYTGVYDTMEDLHEIQSDFLSSIHTELLADRRQQTRRSLVFLQNRDSELVKKWLAIEDRSFDLWVNYYDSNGLCDKGDITSTQLGTKFTAIHELYKLSKHIFEDYDYIWLLDDDIEIDSAQIEHAFEFARRFNAGLAQPTLSDNSFCVWPELFHRPNSEVRYLNTVEIMMPIISVDVFKLTVPEWHRSISGFGLDLLMGYHTQELGLPAIAIDAIIVEHLSRIDQNNGAYYEFLRENDINAKTELWDIVTTYNLTPEIVGITRPSGATPVRGTASVDLSGWQPPNSSVKISRSSRTIDA